MPRVLIVDDSELILQMLTMVVTSAGHHVETAADWAQAQARYAASAPDVVVTDLNLPDVGDPVAAFAQLGAAPVIVVSGRPQAELDGLVETGSVVGAVSKDAGLPGLARVLPDLIRAATGG